MKLPVVTPSQKTGSVKEGPWPVIVKSSLVDAERTTKMREDIR